jgi:hypothetical protein
MARGDVFVIGDLVDYRTAYHRPARRGVVVGFGPHAVVVAFEDGREQTIRAMAAGLRPVVLELEPGASAGGLTEGRPLA